MSSQTWAEWTIHHGTIFGLSSDADVRMLAEWAGLFQSAGWTSEQLHEATDWLALNAPPKYRTDHLTALQGRVRAKLRDLSQRPAEDEEISTCTRCRGAGLVSVPNPKGDGLTPGSFSTMAVACHCALGNWFAAHGGHLSLRNYEFAYPDWPLRMAEHDELLRAQARTTARTRAIDEAMGAIKARQRAAKASTN